MQSSECELPLLSGQNAPKTQLWFLGGQRQIGGAKPLCAGSIGAIDRRIKPWCRIAVESEKEYALNTRACGPVNMWQRQGGGGEQKKKKK